MSVRRADRVPQRPLVSGSPTQATSKPATPKQVVTRDVLEQPRSREDVFLKGTGPGWVDPSPAEADRAPPVATYSGPLFKDEPSASDVQQGQLGDCYVCAALAGLAASNPQTIRNLIKPAADGSADVTFYERDVVSGQFHPVTIHVDPELYESRHGGTLYGHAKGDRSSMELWFPLVEKAYATWRGGYEGVGLGGVQNQMFEAVLGRPAGWLATEGQSLDAVWGTVQATLQAGLPIGAATQGIDDGRYANTGVHANHGYSVLGTETTGSERSVVLRNPWGEGEPRGNGADDGVFRLPLEDFVRLFAQLQFTLV
jgi:hypothetical protein